ncbi:MAG: hypothetical protein HKO62_12245 [Gammaproteobacteria bacterium]|nr:hypothetical protein [Gammaproteobacteria bacterium]
MKRILIAAATAASLVTGSAPAAEISASYEGIIASDSGLGLVGQTMRVDITWDTATAGSPSGNATFYTGLITAATVTVGANVWSYNGSGSTSLFLYNDDVIVFANGPEDRVNLSAGGMEGPELGTGTPLSPPTLAVDLFDLEPAGTPDGLSDDTVLPAMPLDPALFQDTASQDSRMRLSWFTGPIGNIFNNFQVNDFALVQGPPAPDAPVGVPVPVAALLVLAVLLAAAVRRTASASE